MEHGTTELSTPLQTESRARIRARIRLDVALGIVVPLVCFLGDPFYFKGSFLGSEPFFLRYKLVAYGGAGLGMLSLGLWLTERWRSGRWCAFLFGGMGAAGLLAAYAGIAFVALGAWLGLVPLLTACIYFRNAVAAIRLALRQAAPIAITPYALAGLLLVLCTPALAQWRTNTMVRDSIQSIIEGDSDTPVAIRRLAWAWSWGLAGLDPIVVAYGVASDDASRDRLARSYRAMTGQEIKERIHELYW
ncbi:MAG TPA: hypothetical protein VNE39_25410 [Planctomycetota bacterium]|nr:hypothetical protein [Planctomycetota bacterium]